MLCSIEKWQFVGEKSSFGEPSGTLWCKCLLLVREVVFWGRKSRILGRIFGKKSGIL